MPQLSLQVEYDCTKYLYQQRPKSLSSEMQKQGRHLVIPFQLVTSMEWFGWRGILHGGKLKCLSDVISCKKSTLISSKRERYLSCCQLKAATEGLMPSIFLSIH